MKNYLIFLTLWLVVVGHVQGQASQKKLSGPEIWEQVFVPIIVKKFHKDNQSIRKIEALIKKQNGSVVFDHGGTRTPDPEVYTFITRIAYALGLKINNDYKFPQKKLEAIDLQLPDKDSFKWFSTLIKYEEFSPEVRQLVEEDIKLSRPKLSAQAQSLLEKLEVEKFLTEDEAKSFANEILYKYLRRHGPPLKQETLTIIAGESPETVNALLLGPDFNHVAISLNHLKIEPWYGLEVIDVMQQQLQQEGFLLLPDIQGEPSSKLRQMSTLADSSNFPVLLGNEGLISSISYPSKYVEFIQRGYERDEEGKIIFVEMTPKIFLGFLKDNTQHIYSSTDPRPMSN